MINHFVFSAFLACISSLTAAIYFLPKKKATARIFGFYWLCIAFWASTVAFQMQFRTWMPDYVWGWFLHLGCVFIPLLFFHFAIYYSGHLEDEVLVLKIGYMIATAFIVLNTVTPYFTFGTSYRDRYAYPTPAVLYPLYFVYFIVLVIWGTVLLIKPNRKFSVVSQKRLTLFILLNILAYSGALDNFLIMADIRIFPLYPFGLYFVTPYAVIGSYMIARSLRRVTG